MWFKPIRWLYKYARRIFMPSVNRKSLSSKMATCTDPSEDLYYPIGKPSHIQSCSHRHAGNTVYWIFMTTCHLLDVCPTTDSQNENVSPACEDSGASGGFRDSSGCCCIQKCLWHIWLVEWSLFLFRQGSLMAITWIRQQSVTGELYGGGHFNKHKQN